MQYKHRSASKRWTRSLIAIGIGLVVVIGGAVIATRRYYEGNLKPLSANQQSSSIVIPEGYGLKQTADLLKDKSIIRNALVFEQYVRSVNAADQIKAGTYALSPSYSVQQIVSILTEGKIQTNLFTILPGQTIAQIKQSMLVAGFKQDDINSAFNASLYANHPALVDNPAGANLEGFLYPESFQKTADTKAQQIVQESLDQMQDRLTYDIRSSFSKEGLNVYQGVTLASIVEKEVGKASDQSQVAQVFLSRLSQGMRLQSDVTADYGDSLAGQPNGITYDSPYNTYLHDGLPPGPISNVTASALQAVAHPATTNWLYFVAGDDGTTYFSQTAAEHQAQVDQYCHKLCGQ
jgi:UPF0755 protein